MVGRHGHYHRRLHLTSSLTASPAQNLLRSQLAIEYIVKLVEFVWVRYFKELEHKG